MGDSEESFLWLPLMGLGWEENLIVNERQCDSWPFLDRTALLICLPVVSYFTRSCIFPLPLRYCFLGAKQKSRKARDTYMDGVGPDPISLTLAVHVSFLIPEEIIWTVWTDLGYIL